MAVLSQTEVTARLAAVPRWQLQNGSEIVCEHKLSDFTAAVAFVVRIAELAEAANHHPDILIHGWNRVRLTLSTHSEGGLTSADFELAGKIEGLG